ncbi:MAG: hypothetical protein AVDCRST_MAG45-1632, partial [uncultured Solirubrobacterales bacterium]
DHAALLPTLDRLPDSLLHGPLPLQGRRPRGEGGLARAARGPLNALAPHAQAPEGGRL